MQRTNQQSRALHLWFQQKSQQCRDAGVTVQMAFGKTIELEMTPDAMKSILRAVMKAMYGKASTTELEKVGEIDELIEHINRFFSEKFSLEGIPLPSMKPGYANTAPTHDDYRADLLD